MRLRAARGGAFDSGGGVPDICRHEMAPLNARIELNHGDATGEGDSIEAQERRSAIKNQASAAGEYAIGVGKG